MESSAKVCCALKPSNMAFLWKIQWFLCPLLNVNLAVRLYSKWYYVRSGVSISTRRIESAINRFHTKQTKKLLCFVFSKSFDETFCCLKDQFRGHLIYGGVSRQYVSKSIMRQMGCEIETRRTMNQIFIFSSFICFNWSSYSTFLAVTIFS